MWCTVMEVEKDKLEIFQRYLRAYNSFDVDAMLQLISDDVCFENYSNGALTASASNKHQFKELADKGKWFFDARKQEIVSMRPTVEGLEAKIRFSGKLSAEAAKALGASSYVEIDGTSEVEFRGGKIQKLVDRS